MRGRASALILSALVLSCLAEESQAIDELSYLEQTPLEQIAINWEIEKTEDSLSLRAAKSNGEIHTSQLDENGAVLQWRLKDHDANTDITAQRQKNTIIIEGIFKGSRIDKRIAIDSAPWYQTVSFSLTQFIKSESPSATFWSLRPDTLTPYKMRASKRGRERIAVQDREIEAQKIRVKLTGLKAMFWHSDYWFRKTDGLFLQYRGVEGPPGTPPTTITLTSPMPQG